MRRTLLTAAATALLALAPATAFATPGGNAAGGVGDPAFYVDGHLYRTVGTPTDFTDTGAPADSYDVIYSIAGYTNIAEAAPGDPDFNGGRWQVHSVTVDSMATLADLDTDGSGAFDTAEEVEAAIEDGFATDNGVVKSFLCPVIPLPGPRH